MWDSVQNQPILRLLAPYSQIPSAAVAVFEPGDGRGSDPISMQRPVDIAQCCQPSTQQTPKGNPHCLLEIPGSVFSTSCRFRYIFLRLVFARQLREESLPTWIQECSS